MDKIVQRSFIFGSEWLYYKIYTGYKTADLILTDVIKPISEELVDQGYIDKWFFIRYGDPKHHLRVRFRLTNNDYFGKIINSMYVNLRDYNEQELIWKVQLDTYHRELMRYGMDTIEFSETLFYYDSKSIVEFLDLIEGDNGEQLRWLFGLRSIDHLLDMFGYSLQKKLILLDILKTSFGKEFGMARPLKKQLDDKYRKLREEIETFMVFTKESNPHYEPILTILDRKKEKLKPFANQILVSLNSGTKDLTQSNLISSYIHMLMNRLFKSKNRLNEMVSYDFLYRYYKTVLAKKKYKLNSK